jgi:hypothetical protein
MSTRNKTGLADFAVGARPPAPPAPQPPTLADAGAPPAEPKHRQRGKSDMVGLTLRLTRVQWHRVTELAMHEGKSINGMAVDALSDILVSKGLPPL